MAQGAPTAWFDPEVDDEFLQSLPPEARDPKDDLLDPPILLGTGCAGGTTTDDPSADR